MTACKRCGFEPKRGHPQKLNDKKVLTLRSRGLSLAQVAKKFGVTRGAIQASLKRSARGI